MKSYKKYLKSDKWHRIRKKVIERDNYTCQCCRDKNCVLQVHHIIYNGAVMNGQSTSQLITLCEKCHEKVESIRKKYIDTNWDMHKLQIKRYFLSTLMQTNIGISLYEWQLKIWMDCLDSYEDKPKNQYKLRNKIKKQTIVREREDKYLYENYIVSEKMLKKCEGHLCNWLARVKRQAHFNQLMEDHVKGIGSCCKWHFGKKRKIKNKKSKTKNKVLKSILPVVSNQRLAMDNSTSYLKKRIKKIR
tara:strand:+ start:102 stop:839 length:738 start_codon:yes stop_codon:yes gene_type:complete